MTEEQRAQQMEKDIERLRTKMGLQYYPSKSADYVKNFEGEGDLAVAANEKENWRSRPRVARTSGSARFHPSVKDRHLACQRASATTLAAAGASASYSDKTFRSGHASASRTRTCGARGLSGHCLVGPLRRAALAAHPAGEGTRRPRPAQG